MKTLPFPSPRALKIYKFALSARVKSTLVRFPWGSKDKRQEEFGQYLRDGLVELGPTFVKLGQFASTRSDLFPSEIIKELATLQDNVPPMGEEDVFHVLESADIDPDVYFAEFQVRPLAAASLGQAHLATLHGGSEVVVKVQRRGLKESINEDMGILMRLAEVFDEYDTSGLSLAAICEENWRLLLEEIDYKQEGLKAGRFREMFFGKTGIVVPRVLWKYTRERVLVTEYIPGIKINDKRALAEAGIPLDRLAHRLMRLYLHQVVNHGYFHADPHPGNVAVLPDHTIVFYDFGMMGELPETINQSLSRFLVSFYTNDYENLYKEMDAMDMLAPGADLVTITGAVSIFKEYLGSGKVTIDDDLLALALDKPLKLPVDFAFVLRAFSITEGICKKLDPNFDVNAVASPYGTKFMQNIDFEAQMSQYGQSVASFPSRVKHIESFVHSLETGRTKLRVRSPTEELELKKLKLLQKVTVYGILFQTCESEPGRILIVCAMAVEIVKGSVWNAFK